MRLQQRPRRRCGSLQAAERRAVLALHRAGLEQQLVRCARAPRHSNPMLSPVLTRTIARNGFLLRRMARRMKATETRP